MRSEKTTVTVTRCAICGMEHTLFVALNGECLRCGASENLQYSRVINRPHHKTIATAEYETANSY